MKLEIVNFNRKFSIVHLCLCICMYIIVYIFIIIIIKLSNNKLHNISLYNIIAY